MESEICGLTPKLKMLKEKSGFSKEIIAVNLSVQISWNLYYVYTWYRSINMIKANLLSKFYKNETSQNLFLVKVPL